MTLPPTALLTCPAHGGCFLTRCPVCQGRGEPWRDIKPVPADTHKPSNVTGKASGRPVAGSEGRPKGQGGGGQEKALQNAVEAFLLGRGCVRMTPKSFAAIAVPVMRGWPIRGFFAHWPHCEGNPTMPDLLVFNYPNDRPCLMLELKDGERAKFQAGQKSAISIGLWKCAFSLDEAKKIIGEWEECPPVKKS